MKTKLLALLLLVAILTTMLASCEVLEFVNHMLNIFGPGDDSDTNIDLDINIGGTTAHVHTEGVLPATESTCTTHGLTEGRYCTSCEKVLVPQEEAPLKAHTYDNSVDKYCNDCGYERDIDCSHQGTTEFLPATESTCTEAGLTQGVKCTLCGETVVAQETLPLKDHVSSDWIIDEDATTEQEGLRHIECTICGTVTKQEVIPKIEPVTEKLEYTLKGSFYTVSGIGTCTGPDIVIPETYEGLPVREIASNAFKDQKSITSITIPKSIKNIYDKAFESCTSIKDVYYQGELEDWCRITIYNNSASSPMHYGANLYLNGVLLVDLHIPDTVGTISERMFSGCASLKTVTMSDSVKVVGFYAFHNCPNLEKVVIGNSVTTIMGGAFWQCKSLKDIVFSNSVKNIGYTAFSECTSLKTVTLPPNLILMESNVFYKCTSLEAVYIPDTVTKMGQNIFKGCPNLTIYCEYEQMPESGWSDSWNYSNRPVVWNYTGE